MYALTSLKRSHRKFGGRQQGAALIVGMIMLLLLTLIGVAGMRDTLLQEKMAANMRDRDVALQAAETALRAAELTLSAAVGPVFTNNNGLYDLGVSAGLNATKRVKPAISGTVVAEQVFWQQSWSWASSNSIVYNRTLPNLTTAQNPRYVIEKLPQSLTDLTLYPNTAFAAGSGNVAAIDESELDETVIVKPDYRITARAQGLTADTVVILQSTFRRATP